MKLYILFFTGTAIFFVIILSGLHPQAINIESSPSQNKSGFNQYSSKITPNQLGNPKLDVTTEIILDGVNVPIENKPLNATLNVSVKGNGLSGDFVPIDILLLIQESSSISATDFNSIIAWADAFANSVTISSSLRFGIALFDTSFRIALPFSTSYTQVVNQINSLIQSGGDSYLSDALSSSINYFNSSANPDAIHYIVVLTDGQVTAGHEPCSQTTALNDTSIFTDVVGFGSAFDSNEVQCLTDNLTTFVWNASSFSQFLSSFDSRFISLSTLIATNTQLLFEFSENVLTLSSSILPSLTDGNNQTFDLGDIQDQQQWVLNLSLSITGNGTFPIYQMLYLSYNAHNGSSISLQIPSTNIQFVQNSSPVADAGGPYFGLENNSVLLNASKSIDPDGSRLMYRWDFESDKIFDTDWLLNPLFESIWLDDFVGSVILEVDDGITKSQSSANVIIQNVRPEILSTTVIYPDHNDDLENLETIMINNILDLVIRFQDSPNDEITVGVNWGNGLSDSRTLEATFHSGDETVSFKHAYQSKGDYTINVSISDDDGGTSFQLYNIRVIDPTTGSLTQTVMSSTNHLESSSNTDASLNSKDQQTPSNPISLYPIYFAYGLFAVVIMRKRLLRKLL